MGMTDVDGYIDHGKKEMIKEIQSQLIKHAFIIDYYPEGVVSVENFNIYLNKRLTEIQEE